MLLTFETPEMPESPLLVFVISTGCPFIFLIDGTVVGIAGVDREVDVDPLIEELEPEPKLVVFKDFKFFEIELEFEEAVEEAVDFRILRTRRGTLTRSLYKQFQSRFDSVFSFFPPSFFNLVKLIASSKMTDAVFLLHFLTTPNIREFFL